MYVSDLAAALAYVGFVERNHDDFTDKGKTISGLVYMYREYEGQHQYVSLCSYDGVFLEAVVEVFEKVRNTRKPVKPLHCTIYRDPDSLMATLARVYPPLNPAAK